jgi:hypothetical protein
MADPPAGSLKAASSNRGILVALKIKPIIYARRSGNIINNKKKYNIICINKRNLIKIGASISASRTW